MELEIIKIKHKIKPKLSFGSQRGVSALEFTIIAPLVFVLVYGLIEFSCLFYDKAMITNASREGARAGTLFVPDQDEEQIGNRAVDAVKRYLYKDTTFTDLKLIDFGASNPLGIQWSFGDASASGSNRVLKVVVSWKYRFLVLPNFKNLGWVDLANPFVLTAVSEMMMETNPAEVE